MKFEWLRCTASPGMFQDEYAVKAEQYDGATFSLFVHHDELALDAEPTDDHPAEAYLRITPIKRDGDLMLVVLPQPSLEAGSSVAVKTSQLKNGAEVGSAS